MAPIENVQPAKAQREPRVAKPRSVAATVVHRDLKPANASARGARVCSICREPGHYAKSCTAESADDEPRVREVAAKAPVPSSAVEAKAKARRADIIAKRAGSLPAVSASFDVGGE